MLDVSGTDVTVGQLTPDSILRPGGNNLSGIFELQGDLVAASSTTLAIEIGGPNPGNNLGDHDQASVTGAVDLSPLITHRFPLEGFEEAFALMREGESGKIVFQP